MIITIEQKEHEAWMEQSRRQLEESRRAYEKSHRELLEYQKRTWQPKPAKSRRRVVISNDVATLCAAADQYQWELWIKRHPVVGMA